MAFLQLGAARLELIESAPHAPRRMGLVDHVALEVRDLGGLLRHLEQRGVTLVDREPIDVPGLNARILFCLGPRWRAHRALRARSAMSHEPSAVSRSVLSTASPKFRVLYTLNVILSLRRTRDSDAEHEKLDRSFVVPPRDDSAFLDRVRNFRNALLSSSQWLTSPATRKPDAPCRHPLKADS